MSPRNRRVRGREGGLLFCERRQGRTFISNVQFKVYDDFKNLMFSLPHAHTTYNYKFSISFDFYPSFGRDIRQGIGKVLLQEFESSMV